MVSRWNSNSFHEIITELRKEELWIMNSDGSNQHYIGIEGFAAKWSSNGNGLFILQKPEEIMIYILVKLIALMYSN